MSLDLAYGPSLPETESPIFLAMTEISAATSPTEVIDSLRQYILPDADRLSLIQVDFGTAGEAVYRTIAAWDRDDLDIEDSPPAAIRELVGADPLVLPNVAVVNAPDDPLVLYAENTLQAQSFVLYPLVGRARTVGYLICAYRQPHQFDDLEVQAMRILIRQVATVSENFLLLEALSVRTEHLSLINNLAEAIKGSIDLHALGDLVAGEAPALLLETLVPPRTAGVYRLAQALLACDDPAGGPAGLDPDLLDRGIGADLDAHLHGEGDHVFDQAVNSALGIPHPQGQICIGDQAVHGQGIVGREAEEHGMEGEGLGQLVVVIKKSGDLAV